MNRCGWPYAAKRSIMLDWIFEIKYDGFRSLARVAAGGQAELISRRRHVYKSGVGEHRNRKPV
jgi:ATP-dependent DNA ligase